MSEIEEHLRNAAALKGGEAIPTKWDGVLKVMRELGYSCPQHFKVCVSSTHSFLLRNKQIHSACPICGQKWETFLLSEHHRDSSVRRATLADIQLA